MGNKKISRKQLGGWQEDLLLDSQGQRKGYGNSSNRIAVGDWRVRVRALWLVMFCAIVILGLRLIYLSVFDQGRQALLSENNSLTRVRDKAPRGEILDHDGRELAIDTEKGREYLLDSKAAHLLGYLSEVTEDELGCNRGICYLLGDLIGRSGIEKSMEYILKGKDGGRIVEVDVTGKEVREMGSNQSEAGSELVLSIDRDLQSAVASSIGARVGAVVALDMQGKVLALYSSPSYDPNLFTLSYDEVAKQALLSDKEHEYFLNRVIGGAYAPGSVFKLVTAYAGLESGEIEGDTLIEDTGEIKIDQYRFGNWYYDQYGKTEGKINLEKALARSNDIFFYKVGEQVGVDELSRWASKFGLGEETGIELAGEVAGLVPTRLWKERISGERWFLGNTYHYSIGQGDLTATPLQVARMTLAAVSGRKCNVSVLEDSKVECEDLGLSTKNMEIVRAGMKAACQPEGTAFPFFEFAPYVLCKTGTAEHAGQAGDDEVLPHAWITIAYPGENPEMILTVMLDSAGEGSYEAGPVAKKILEKWRELGN